MNLPAALERSRSGNGAHVWLFFEEAVSAGLASIKKISRVVVEHLVEEAEAKGRVVGVRLDIIEEENRTPWKPPTSLLIVGELPKKLNLVMGNEIFIAKEALPPALLNRLIRIAAFQNPDFYKAQAMRLPVYDKPRIIGCARDYSHHIGLPRGCLDEIIKLLRDLKIKYALQDELYDGLALDAQFQGELRPDQVLAVDAMIKSDIGVLSATTAFGKTVVAAWLIAKRQVNTLIIVHTKQLQDQWVERLQTFLNLPAKKIGRFGGGRKKITGLVDVALIQSLTC
jgi:hypothetical protein